MTKEKCCILVPEGTDKSRWVSFLSMITFKTEIATRKTFSKGSSSKREGKDPYISTSDEGSPKCTHAEVLSPLGSPNTSPRKKTDDIFYNNDISMIDAEEDFDWEQAFIVIRRCFHDNW